jgi:3D (Asp-Asp-Asp) domain-containing protein
MLKNSRKLSFSDLLPLTLARVWRFARRMLMFCVAGLVISTTSVGTGRTILSTPGIIAQPHSVAQSALPVQTATVSSSSTELMHDAPIEVPTVQSNKRIVWMEVTAYCACPKCCGPNAQGITASGKLVDYNGGKFVAADTSVLPFGTRLLIPGYDAQAVEVIDRGGAIKGNHLDVFFATHEQALQWGRQWIPVTVVD